MTIWLFLCDANSKIGLGHLSRCLGFAEAARDSFHEVFFVGDYDAASRGLLKSSGINCRSDRPSLNFLSEPQYRTEFKIPKAPAGIFIDSYELEAKHLDLARTHWPDARLVVLDDLAHLAAYRCDLVVNFTVDAESVRYPAGTSLLAGPKYFAPRRWLRMVRDTREYRAFSARFVVFAGGSDQHRINERLTNAILEVAPGSEIRVVQTQPKSETSWFDSLAPFQKKSVTIWPITPDMATHFLWTDIVLCGGGLIKYECVYAEIPVAAFSQTDRQQLDTSAWAAKGLVGDLGIAYKTDDDTLRQRLRSWLNVRRSSAFNTPFLTNNLDENVQQIFGISHT